MTRISLLSAADYLPQRSEGGGDGTLHTYDRNTL